VSTGPELRTLHHIGISVAEIGPAVDFWQRFLGVTAIWRRLLDGPYLSAVTGYPGINLDGAMIPLPGGAVLELLEYRIEGRVPHDPATAHPGNVHICFVVDDIEEAWGRALDCGATPVSPGPVDVTVGPNAGARTCYLRDPEGVTIELFQRRPEAT
jgi:catechol 2,3-dioxygenase-like lactoylglutathione lyase family enzyme